jgi:hypothetical protein
MMVGRLGDDGGTGMTREKQTKKTQCPGKPRSDPATRGVWNSTPSANTDTVMYE